MQKGKTVKILDLLQQQAARSFSAGRQPHAQQQLSDGRKLLVTAWGSKADPQYDYILDGFRVSELEVLEAFTADENISRVENM